MNSASRRRWRPSPAVALPAAGRPCRDGGSAATGRRVSCRPLSRRPWPARGCCAMRCRCSWPMPRRPSASAFVPYCAQVPSTRPRSAKLVTTYAALDQLGPAYTWNTPVYVDGPGARGQSCRAMSTSVAGRSHAGGGAPVAADAAPARVSTPSWAISCWTRSAFDLAGHAVRSLMASPCAPTTPHPMRCCSISSRW